MAALEPQDLELLYFLCAVHAHPNCRVVSIKVPLRPSLRRLRYAGLIAFEGYAPSASAIAEWLDRRNRAESQTDPECLSETPAEASFEAEPPEPPEPEVAAEGDGAARCDAPSPIDEERLLDCFGDEFEPLSAVSERFGTSSAKIVRHARTLRERGSVECEAPSGSFGNGQRKLLWRRAPKTKLSPITADDLKDLPPAVLKELSAPTRRLAEQAAPTPVDIKVNAPARRDPTQRPELPLTELRDIQIRNGMRHAASVRRAQEAEATRLLDAGVDPSSQNSLMSALMRQVIRRREDEARLADPIEQAKALLRRRYTPVVGAQFADPPGREGDYLVGRRIVSTGELLAMAAEMRS